MKVYLVTGGYNNVYLSSTEVLIQGGDIWQIVGELPRARLGLRAVSIDKNIIVTGKVMSMVLCFIIL